MEYMFSSVKRKGGCRRIQNMAHMWVTLAVIAAVVPSILTASLWPQTDCCSYDVIFYVDILDMSEFEFSQMRDTLMIVSNSIDMDLSGGTRLGLVLVPHAEGEIPLTADRTEFQNGLNNLFFMPDAPRNVAAAINRASEMFGEAPSRPHIRKVAIGILNGISAIPTDTARAAHTARINYVYMGVIGITSQPVETNFNTELFAIASEPESKYVYTTDSYTLFLNGPIEEFYSKILMQSGICCDCQWKNYLHFYSDPADPNAFLQCERLHTFVRRYCALGLFWDQTQSSCVPAFALLLKDDPCRWYEWEVYGDSKEGRNCRAFWICNPGIQTIFIDCCPAFTRFNSLSHVFDCFPDDTCDDDCPPINPSEPIAPTLLPSIRTALPQPVPVSSCFPELYIDFTNGVQDLRDYYYVENYGVRVITGSSVPAGANFNAMGERAVGYFNGNSFLVIPRFAYGWYGDSIEYHFRYRPILPTSENELELDREDILLTNGDCGIDDTLLATYLPNRHQVSTAETGSLTPRKLLTVPAAFEGNLGDWLSVTVKLHLSDLSIDSREPDPVQTHSANTPFFGHIEQTKPALHIGGYSESSLSKYVNFHGYIDEFWLYLCDPSV